MLSTNENAKKWLPTISVASVLALGLAACGDEADAGNGEGGGDGELSGTVLIDGSSTVEPVSSAAAELFMSEHGGVQVSVGTSGTGGGFEKFCNGETDISDASREIAEDEIAACEANGVEFEQLTVANDALSVVVNPENPVDCLTTEQLAAIWAPDSTLSSSSLIGREASEMSVSPLQNFSKPPPVPEKPTDTWISPFSSASISAAVLLIG